MTPAATLVALGAAVSQALSVVAGYVTSLDARIAAVSVVMATVTGITIAPTIADRSQKKLYSIYRRDISDLANPAFGV
jgi:hypothetical protein